MIITLITAFISNFAGLEVVKNAFAGIRVCVFVLILNAVIKLAKKAVVDKVTLAICLLVLIGAVLLDVSPVIFVLAAGLIGVIVQVWMKNEVRK